MAVFKTPVGTKYRASNNLLLHTIPRLGREWSVSLRLKLIGAQENRPQSVLHVAESLYGSGIPAIWTVSQRNIVKIKVSFPVDGDPHYSRQLDNELSLQDWTTIKVTHKLHGGKYYYKILINNQPEFTIQNSQAQVYEDVQVYAGNPWFMPVSGFIKQIIIKTGDLSSQSLV